MGQTTSAKLKKCPFCSQIHEGQCPIVKSVEYYPNGTIKKVEYVTEDEMSYQK